MSVKMVQNRLLNEFLNIFQSIAVILFYVELKFVFERYKFYIVHMRILTRFESVLEFQFKISKNEN